MSYVLDTDSVICFFKGHPAICDKIATIFHADVKISIITHSELFFGAYNSQQITRNCNRIQKFVQKIEICPYTIQASILFGQLKADLKKEGKMIADMDLMIASICLAENQTLVTNNTKHFRRIKQLKIENWSVQTLVTNH